jgi:hypothetical protein
LKAGEVAKRLEDGIFRWPKIEDGRDAFVSCAIVGAAGRAGLASGS